MVKGQEEEVKEKKKEEWRQSLQEGNMVQTLDSSPKTRRTHSSESKRENQLVLRNCYLFSLLR